MSSDREAAVAAATAPRRVTTHRPGAMKQAQLLLEDFHDTQRRQAETETHMVAVFDEPQLNELACSIVDKSALGTATILAETGDLTRFATARAVVKHSGLAQERRAAAPTPVGPS